MSRRHILADLHDYKLDPKKAHTLHKAHLKHETKAAELLPAAVVVSEVHVELPVEVVAEPTEIMTVIEPLGDELVLLAESELPPETLEVEEETETSTIIQPEKKTRKMKKRDLE